MLDESAKDFAVPKNGSGAFQMNADLRDSHTHTYVLLKHVETYSEANITKSPMWRIPQKSWQDKKDNTSDNWRPQGRSAFVETTTCFCISWKQDIDKRNRHPKKPNV